jgi:hypothetical protein
VKAPASDTNAAYFVLGCAGNNRATAARTRPFCRCRSARCRTNRGLQAKAGLPATEWGLEWYIFWQQARPKEVWQGQDLKIVSQWTFDIKRAPVRNRTSGKRVSMTTRVKREAFGLRRRGYLPVPHVRTITLAGIRQCVGHCCAAQCYGG